MKLKVSRKQMNEYYAILGVGGYALQHLLKGVDPIAYSSGVYGWACDYYELPGLLVSMGYNALSSKLKNKKIKTDYALIKDYDNKARLIYNNGGSYDGRINAIKLLRNEFINKVKGLK